MRKFVLVLLSFFSLNFYNITLSQGLRINEVLSLNNSTVADEDGDFSDWIEIFNSGISDINLKGYGLSDDSSTPFKWVFPAATIRAGGYLLVWASGKNKTVDPNYLHANFSINADGEDISITSPENNLIDKIPGTQIPKGFSYGRDNQSNLVFFAEPSPKVVNGGTFYASILKTPVFSHSGGMYAAPFDLVISSDDPEASIIYTLDGSVPEIDNLKGTTFTYKNQYPSTTILKDTFSSKLYAAPIPVYDRTTESNQLSLKSTTYDNRIPTYFPTSSIHKGFVVRARLFKEGSLPGKVITNSYFVSAAPRYSLPVVSLATPEDAFFGYENGIYTAGKDFDEWRAANPQGRPDGTTPANYQRTTEQPVHLEIFETSQKRVLSQDIGVRIHGGFSAANPAKSLRLYAREEYNASEMDYPIFPNLPYNKYKRLILRNSGNDFYYSLFRDAAMQSITGHLSFETQASRPSILFINGEYWGIHTITERYDKYYLESKYKVDPENINIISSNTYSGKIEIEEGSEAHYQETIKYIETNGLTSKEHYDYIATRIDIDNFIEYQLSEIFIGNTDWPGNNMKAWRTENEFNPSAGPRKDGRWRWMMFDTDFGLGLYNASYTTNDLALAAAPASTLKANPPWSTYLFRKLLENQTFKKEFINRFSDQLNSAFLPQITQAKLNELRQIIAPEIEEHIQRWKQPASLKAWEDQVNIMLKYLAERPAYQREHLRSFFQLGKDYLLTLNISDPTHGSVIVNKLALKSTTPGLPSKIYPWSGTYFQGIPIQLEAIPAPGYEFIGWAGSMDSTKAKITINPTGNISLTAVFKKKQAATLVHYFNFNNSQALTNISYTLGAGSLKTDIALGNGSEITYGTGNGFMGINKQFADTAGTHLRINNPIGSQLIFSLPTTGFSNINFQYETRRSTQGAAMQIIEYTLNGTAYTEIDKVMISDNDPILVSIDFNNLVGVNNNANFAIRIRFEQGQGGIAGNNRFDNITLSGIPLEGMATNEAENYKIFLENSPNPFDQSTTITLTLDMNSTVKLTLCDATGKIWYDLPAAQMHSGKNEITINTNELSSGVFFLICRSEKYQSHLKLVKY